MENAVERYENIAHVPWETMKTKNTTNGDNVNGFVVFFFGLRLQRVYCNGCETVYIIVVFIKAIELNCIEQKIPIECLVFIFYGGYGIARLKSFSFEVFFALTISVKSFE